jgi:hypothetical protein
MHSTLLALGTLLFLTACGENTNTESYATKYYPTYEAQSGKFIDSGVEGITYVKTAGGDSLTKAGGSFEYHYGDTVTFKIGNLVIGETIALSVVTPKDIVSYKNLELNTSINAPEVNNRVRLLISLDSDNNPANGIEINATTRAQGINWATPNYDLNESAFSAEIYSATNGEVSSLKTMAEATAHFESSLRCVYSGAYSGRWILPNGARSGFVGVMIQSNGTIVTLGDGQDLNNDGIYEEFLFARGQHYMDNGYYDFNETGAFNETLGSIVPSSKIVQGDGESQGYNFVKGSFEQKNPDTNVTQTGSYEATRVGSGSNVSYRYTGYGFANASGAENPSSDPILGLFTFDISRDGKIVGLIHDARTNEEPPLIGNMNFDTSIVDMNLTYPNGDLYRVTGALSFDGSVNLDWYDISSNKLGYIDGVGCQLQTHN